jgi:hypothetical protein
MIMEKHEHDEILRHDESEIADLKVEKDHDEVLEQNEKVHEDRLLHNDENDKVEVEVEDEEGKSKRFLMSL